MISIECLHKECKIISIEHRIQKQLLWLMFLLSKSEKYLRTNRRNTQSANKLNFKGPNKITHVYEHSPYYVGTKVWDALPETIQKLDNVYSFKKEFSKPCSAYKKLI